MKPGFLNEGGLVSWKQRKYLQALLNARDLPSPNWGSLSGDHAHEMIGRLVRRTPDESPVTVTWTKCRACRSENLCPDGTCRDC